VVPGLSVSDTFKARCPSKNKQKSILMEAFQPGLPTDHRCMIGAEGGRISNQAFGSKL
jgi:hypothetical protein